ncbi:MAG: patatin-like phospholipase family protein [Clostridia bacterium]|nr:patatin-like phospholipase family protein [Clostridia bacterium]
MWGLALEGGGTKGAYHVGVFRALRELNIPVKCVVGTSIGAVNGALFAQGDIDKLSELWHDISISDIIALPEKVPQPHNILDIRNIGMIIGEICRKKGLDITPFEDLLHGIVDEGKIRNGTTLFGLATYCISGKAEKQFFLNDIPEGMLVDYILASACFPGFQIRNIENNLYIDGGVANNLPVNMLIEQGCSDIISVEVGGFGITKKSGTAGCNVITVKCGEDIVGNLDFNHDGIMEMEKLGYYDALKAFGLCMGGRYSFHAVDYLLQKRRLSEGTIRGIESAARYFGIDCMRIYKLSELAQLVIEHFHAAPVHNNIFEILKWSDGEKAACLARAILNSDAEVLNNKIIAGILGEMFEAASAVAYLERNIQNI